jgi:hypothetical protein
MLFDLAHRENAVVYGIVDCLALPRYCREWLELGMDFTNPSLNHLWVHLRCCVVARYGPLELMLVLW